MAGKVTRLIEVDLPIRQVSDHSRKEKTVRHGHLSTLHLWWARRPLAACRAVVCASLWPDPADPVCPQGFAEMARKLMVYWSKRGLAKCSSGSFSRFNRIAQNPLCLENPFEIRAALLDFIADFSAWENGVDREYVRVAGLLTTTAHRALRGDSLALGSPVLSFEEIARLTYEGDRPLVLDPFAGGGAIPLESLRCGADAFASDLNPVAALLNRVAEEYIPRHGSRLLELFEKWGEWLCKRVADDLAPFYPVDADGALPVTYLWARVVRCEGPGCGATVPMMRSQWLCKKSRRLVAVMIKPVIKTKTCSFIIVAKRGKNWIDQVSGEDLGSEIGLDGTVARGAVNCPFCGFTTPVSAVREQLKRESGGANTAVMFAVAVKRPSNSGRSYRAPTADDLSAVAGARAAVARRRTAMSGSMPEIPDDELPLMSGVFNAPIYGHSTWASLFTDRQLLAITTIVRRVREVGALIAREEDPGVAEAVQCLLSLALGKQADLANALCAWEPIAECPRHLFGRQAIGMVWDFAEGVPTGNSSGGLIVCVKNLAATLEGLGHDWRPGAVEVADAAQHPLADDMVQLLYTDPPYYNAVPYADLSDFFYVWLRRSLPDTIRERWFYNPRAPKDDECCEMAGWDPKRYPEKTGAWYEERMGKAFAEGRRVLAPDGLGVIVFAHKTTEGWEALLQALLHAGFVITGSWPVDTECGSRLRAMNSATLASSVHLVCRPREADDGSLVQCVGDWRDVLGELPGRIQAWLPRLAAEGVVGADAIFACLGPALEIFSRYSSVEKASGERVELREYLEQVWAEVARQALNMIFEGGDASGLEEDGRLTAMWLWTLRSNSDLQFSSSDLDEDDESDDGSEQSKISNQKSKIQGYALEYDAARKIAQGLGCHLESLGNLVEVKGETATLLSAGARARYLFGRDDVDVPKKRGKKKGADQGDLFAALALPSDDELEREQAELDRPAAGKTVLDQLHQSMILFGVGRGQALKRFLVDDGIGTNPQYWKLAQAFSALYPPQSEEKRWVDGVLARKKSLGI